MGNSRFACFAYRGKNGRRAPIQAYFINYMNHLTRFNQAIVYFTASVAKIELTEKMEELDKDRNHHYNS